MTDTVSRAKRVVRLSALSQYLGVGRTAIQNMIDAGLLHPFCPTGKGGRAKVVFEDEVAELQEMAKSRAKASRRRPTIIHKT